MKEQTKEEQEKMEAELEAKRKEQEIETKKDELGNAISKCVDELKELGLDAMLICSQPDLDVEGIWCTTNNAVIRNGLVRLADKTI